MKKLMMLVAVVLTLAGASAKAAPSQNVNFYFEMPFTFDLAWNVDGSNVDLTGANAITMAEIAQGFKNNIPGGELIATANTDYSITVMAESEYLTGGGDIKPASDILVSVAGQEFVPVSGLNPVQVYSGAAEYAALKGLDYTIILNSTDLLGTYSTVLTYTIAALAP